MTNPAQIAATLTHGQKRLLLGLIDRPMRPSSYAQVRSQLMKKGLWGEVGFSPLGLQVRAILEEQTDGE